MMEILRISPHSFTKCKVLNEREIAITMTLGPNAYFALVFLTWQCVGVKTPPSFFTKG